MKLKYRFIILLCLAAACSRSGPVEDADAILRAKALYQEVYAAYVTKSIHPGSVIKKLDQALGLVPEDHEYHRKILRLKTRIEEKKEQPPPPDREAIDIIPPPESSDPAEKPPAKEAGDLETGTIDVGVSGHWAFVYIDGNKIRTTPLLNCRLKTGEHLVELLDGDGNVVRSWKINLSPGEREKLLHQTR